MSVREKDRSRTWCFTINHYSAETEDDLDTVIEKLVGLGSVHMVIGKKQVILELLTYKDS